MMVVVKIVGDVTKVVVVFVCVSNDEFGVLRPVLLLLLLLGGSKSNDDGPLSLPFRDDVNEGRCGGG